MRGVRGVRACVRACSHDCLRVGAVASVAFGGDKSLKVMQQMMAASQAGRDLVYHAFGTTYRGRLLAEWIDELQGLVAVRQLTVGTLLPPLTSQRPSHTHALSLS